MKKLSGFCNFVQNEKEMKAANNVSTPICGKPNPQANAAANSVDATVSGKQRRKKIKKAASQPKERSEPGRRGSPAGKAVENQKDKEGKP